MFNIYEICKSGGNLEEIEKILTKDNITNIFTKCCEFENINVLKFLLNIQDEYGKIDIHIDDESAFINACINGNLEVIKFLLSLKDEYGKIDIHINHESAFIDVCLNGHLEVIKFLLSLKDEYGKIDIHIYSAFRDACLNGHLEVVKFLLSLSNEYGKFTINNIKIINDIKNKFNLQDNEIINYFNCDIYLLLKEYKDNKLEENKTIIEIELDECPICSEEKKYFLEYQCNQKHLICIDCLENTDQCYFCRVENVFYDRLYINLKFETKV